MAENNKEMTDRFDQQISQVKSKADELLSSINIEEISHADRMNFYIRLVGMYERLLLARYAKVDDNEREDKFAALAGYQKWLRGEVRAINEIGD
jgi:hypothetical protein